MIIAQNDDVELISIKTKSLQELDSIDEDKTNVPKINENFKNFPKSFITNDKSSDKENENDQDDDHYDSSVRFITIDKSPNGACGFHLTRTKWDPYPWVSAVDDFTPAAKSDLKAGDCVLEVNGCDVLGLRITEIAKLVKSSQHQVTLLLWSTNCNTKCNEESLCAAPMPRSLQRLSLVVQKILGLIECPVCLDTITPPAMQCQNGHLLCVNCRIRAEKCPVCRDRYYPRPALIAEQIQSAITSAFNLCRNEDKVRQKIFGRHQRQRQMVKTTLECMQQQRQQKQEQQQDFHKSLETNIQTVQPVEKQNSIVEATTEINRKCVTKVTDKYFKCTRSNSHRTVSNKFLTKFLNSKAYSMENLANGHNTNTAIFNNNFNTCPTTTTSKSMIKSAITQQQASEPKVLFKDFTTKTATHQQHTSTASSTSTESNTNQFNDFPNNNTKNNPYNLNVNIVNDLNINSKLCCKQIQNNKMKHFSSSSIDLTTIKENLTTASCLLDTNQLEFINGKCKRPQPKICETSYATIPRAIKLKHQTKCQNDVHHTKDNSCSVRATNFSKSYSSSMTSLNLSLTMSSSSATTTTTPCCSSCSCCYSTSSFSSVTQNCQSSLSADTSVTSTTEAAVSS